MKKKKELSVEHAEKNALRHTHGDSLGQAPSTNHHPETPINGIVYNEWSWTSVESGTAILGW